MKLPIVCALIAVAAAAPGLLRVPKVYNAVITSNQNLSPSRAIPVIQPIIQRTYVPPIYYYTQVARRYLVVPEAVRHPSFGGKTLGNDQAQATSSTSRLVESTSFGTAKERETTTTTITTTERGKDDDSKSTDDARNNSNDSLKNSPLSFYPNYNSQYYVPYVYNTLNPPLVPGTYSDYRYSTVEPIPPVIPERTGWLLPSFRDEERTKNKQTIPNVPPPPLPTTVPKNLDDGGN